MSATKARDGQAIATRTGALRAGGACAPEAVDPDEGLAVAMGEAKLATPGLELRKLVRGRVGVRVAHKAIHGPERRRLRERGELRMVRQVRVEVLWPHALQAHSPEAVRRPGHKLLWREVTQ